MLICCMIYCDKGTNFVGYREKIVYFMVLAINKNDKRLFY